MCFLGNRIKKATFTSVSCISHDVYQDFHIRVSTKAALRQHIKDYTFAQIKSSQITWIRTRFRFKIVTSYPLYQIYLFINQTCHSLTKPAQYYYPFVWLAFRAVCAQEVLTGHHTCKRQLFPPPSVILPNREAEEGKGKRRRKKTHVPKLTQDWRRALTQPYCYILREITRVLKVTKQMGMPSQKDNYI